MKIFAGFRLTIGVLLREKWDMLCATKIVPAFPSTEEKKPEMHRDVFPC